MAEYKRIVIVNVREDGQPDKLISLGDNDNISDDVLSPTVKDAVASVPGLKDATGVLNNQVTSLNTATGTLQTQIDGIDGISVTAIENDVTALFAATGSNFNDITGIQDATGSLQSQIDAIDGISVTAIENDVTALFAATGSNFGSITGIIDATGNLQTDLDICIAGTGTNFHSVTGINDATGNLTNSGNFPVTQLNNNLDADGNSIEGLVNVKGRDAGAFVVSGNATTLTSKGGPLSLIYGTELQYRAESGGDLLSIPGQFTDALDGTAANFHSVTGINQATGVLDTNVGIALDGTAANFHSVTGINDATGNLETDIGIAIAGTGSNFNSVTSLESNLAATGALALAATGTLAGKNTLDATSLFDNNIVKFEKIQDITAGRILGKLTGDGDQQIKQLNSSQVRTELNVTGSLAQRDDANKLYVFNGSSVVFSGVGGSDDQPSPANGAIMVIDTVAERVKFRDKISGTKLEENSLPADVLQNNSITNAQLATNAASDNITAGALNSIAFAFLPLCPSATFVGNNASIGGNMKTFTAAEARSLINDGNQEITGNVGINTASTPTAPLQIEDTGTADAIYVESSDTGADAGPVITLKRDSASPAGADYLGQIKFKGESSTGVERVYAKITAKIDDPTNGSEDGALEIMNRFNGANQIAVRLKEDSFRLLNSVELHVDGNTGLGTNNPSEKLDVQGNIAVTGTVDGRDIAADGTKLDGIEGAYAVGTTAPSSPTGGDLWYNTTDDELYTYDSGRGHWLGAPYYISMGKTTSTAPGVGHYLYVGHAGTTATTQERGWLVPHDMVITGWRGHTKSTFTGWTFRIDKNSGGTNTTGIVSTGALGAVDTFSDFTLDVDVAAGDILGVPGVTGTSTIDNSTVTIKIQRKGA